MKLAEALIERKDLQTKIAQIRSRMQENVKVQEGEEPAESVYDLLPQYDKMMTELEQIIVRINRTNATVYLGDVTLSEAITRRDCIGRKISAYRDLREEAAIRQNRFSSSEIKFVRCIDIVSLQTDIDRLSKEYRELDTSIQEHNWLTDLV